MPVERGRRRRRWVAHLPERRDRVFLKEGKDIFSSSQRVENLLSHQVLMPAQPTSSSSSSSREISSRHENYLGPISATPQLMCERIVDAIFPSSSSSKTHQRTDDDKSRRQKEVVVFDIGCNDARVLIAACQKNERVRGIGIEIDPVAAANARNNVRKCKLENRIEIREQDALTVTEDDLRRAEYIFLYLLPKGNEKIAKLLREKMSDRCKIVCYMFKLPENDDDKFWTKRLTKEVAFENSRKRERKGVDSSRYNRIYVYGSTREMVRREKIGKAVRAALAIALGVACCRLK